MWESQPAPLVTLRYNAMMPALASRFGFAAGTKAAGALEARVRNLKRQGFPPTGAGLHQKVRYGILELAQLTVALRLEAAYVPPNVVVRLLGANKRAVTFAALLGLAAARYLRTDPRWSSDLGLLVLPAGALDELGTREARSGRFDVPEVGAMLVPGWIRRVAPPSGVIVDVVTLGRDLATQLDAIGANEMDAIADLVSAALGEDVSGEPTGLPSPPLGPDTIARYRWQIDALLAITGNEGRDEAPSDQETFATAALTMLALTPEPAARLIPQTPYGEGSHWRFGDALVTHLMRMDHPAADAVRHFEAPIADMGPPPDGKGGGIAGWLRRTVTSA